MNTGFGIISKLLLGIVLFIGLPILAWGVTDISGFFANPARLWYVVLTVALQIWIVILNPNVGSGSGEGKTTVRRQKFAILILQIVAIALVLVAPFCDRRSLLTMPDSSLIRWLGFALLAPGFVAMNWAEYTLGRQFSVHVTIQENHRLITSGIYRYIRHPRYLGILVYDLGFALLFQSWLALALVTALLIVLLCRIHDEEILMAQTFGDEWHSYCRTSYRLVPFVY